MIDIAHMLRRWRRRSSPPPAFLRVAYTTPRQVVLLTSRHDGVDNVWPVDWHVPLSLEPPLYGVALTPDTFGTSLVRASGVFVVNFVPADWTDAILFCGRNSGRTADKFAETGLEREAASEVSAPRLAGALGSLECRVEQVVETGDHEWFVGRVVRSVEHEPTHPRLHHVASTSRRPPSDA